MPRGLFFRTINFQVIQQDISESFKVLSFLRVWTDSLLLKRDSHCCQNVLQRHESDETFFLFVSPDLCFIVLPPILVPRQAETGVSSSSNNLLTSIGSNQQPSVTATAVTIQDLLSLDDLPLSITDSPDFIMSTAGGVNTPSPASSLVGSDGSGGTFPLTETPPPGYMSEDGDTQEPADLMSPFFNHSNRKLSFKTEIN